MWRYNFTIGAVAWGRVLVATSTERLMWLCCCPLAGVEDGEQGVLSRRGEEGLGGGVKENRSTPLGQHLEKRSCRFDYSVTVAVMLDGLAPSEATYGCLHSLRWLLWGRGRSEVSQVTWQEQDITAEHKQPLQHI